MKLFKWIFILLFLGVTGFLAWHFLSPYSKTSPLEAIPPNAVFIAETDNLFDAWAKLTTNKAWLKLKRQPIFASIDKGVNMLDTIIQSNKQLSEFVGKREVFVSMNLLGNGKYDMAYLIDLRRVSKLLEIKNFITDFSTSSIRIVKVPHKVTDLFEITVKSSQQKFYCYFNNNLFVGSFSKVLLEKSIDNPVNQQFSKDPNFQKIMDETSHSGMFRLYVNYDKLDDYLKGMMVTLDESTRNFTQSLRYTGLTFNISDDGTIGCEGITMLNDSVHSSLRAIIQSGTGNSSIEDILPQKFATSVSLCFNKFTDYFDNMQESLKKTPYAYDNYQKEISQVEKFLDINVRKNFMDWIDDEVALAQMEPMGLGKDNEFAVFLKARDIGDAKENLDYIAKKIKHRTPIKIEDIDYKGYPINYLSVKGFFKIFLGKYFKKLEKPYYTIIGDYVILSNHPQVLKVIIDAQADKTYLKKHPDFSDFYGHFGRKSNGLMLINTTHFIETLKYSMKPGTYQQLEQTRENLQAFPLIGFQLDKDGDYFRTRFYACYADHSEIPSGNLIPVDSLGNDSLSAVNPSAEIKAWIQNADSYVPADLTQKVYKETYPDGATKVEIEIQDGFRNGDYREYYENGKVKLKGQYKADKKHGTWKAYDENDKLILKMEFKNGETVSQ